MNSYDMKYWESESANQESTSISSLRLPSAASRTCAAQGKSESMCWFPLPCSIVQYSSIMSIAMVPIICIFSTIPACLSQATAALPQLPIPLWHCGHCCSKHLQLQHCECLGTMQRLRQENPRNLSGAPTRRRDSGEMHLFLNETIVSLTGFINHTKNTSQNRRLPLGLGQR